MLSLDKTERPGFRAGTIKLNFEADPLPIDRRKGEGNNHIERPGFRVESFPNRLIPDFDNIFESFSLANQGHITIPEPLTTLLNVRIPDKDDTSWIAEKRRMTKELKDRGFTDNEIETHLRLNKPLGREQRMISVPKHTITTAVLNTEKQLVEIAEEIVNGNAESKKQQEILTTFLERILDKSNLEKPEEKELFEPIAERILGVKDNPASLGIPFRWIDASYYSANKGKVDLFLLNKARNDTSGVLSLSSPIKSKFIIGVTPEKDRNSTIGLETALRKMRKDKFQKEWIDLLDSRLVTQKQINDLVKEGMPRESFSNQDLLPAGKEQPELPSLEEPVKEV